VFFRLRSLRAGDRVEVSLAAGRGVGSTLRIGQPLNASLIFAPGLSSVALGLVTTAFGLHAPVAGDAADSLLGAAF
jgi:hypothetical protein